MYRHIVVDRGHHLVLQPRQCLGTRKSTWVMEKGVEDVRPAYLQERPEVVESGLPDPVRVSGASWRG